MSLDDVLSKNDYSLTQPRQIIFNLLKTAGRPLDISEVLQQCPSVDRATVYRTLNLYEELGIVQEVWLGNKQRYELSESFDIHHHHLVCEKCGRVEKFNNQAAERIMQRIAKRHNYKGTTHNLELYGLCPSCSAKKTR